MVEVFRTSVERKGEAVQLINLLAERFPFLRINFDLEDCDRILRVEGIAVPAGEIIKVMTAKGFICQVLD